MSARIEDYALIGDCQTVALVSREGSIDWLCLPRVDSGACFAALLGTPEHGRWSLAPADSVRSIRRHYREGTLVLETDFETETGAVTVIDCMPVRDTKPDLVRIAVGRRGQVAMRTEIVIRFDYGSIVPWVRRQKDGILATAGPDSLRFTTDVELHGENLKTVGDFTVSEGQRIPFVMTWHASHEQDPKPIVAEEAVEDTANWWREWSSQCTYQGEYREQVVRSLITLKALTYAPTGGIVAAATTSLPEWIGGVRNWDYRYCWLRDATFTLYSLLQNGYRDEACAWREWLLRAVAGRASQLNILYGVAGERRLTEFTVGWLPGYENSAPVRIGNAAYTQFQLDVFGEIAGSLHLARTSGLQPTEADWRLEAGLLEFLESNWEKPDEGIWEIRGPRQHFTHSKVMAWMAFDRAVKDAERFGLEAPLERWRGLRDTIHADVCTKAYDPELRAFVQHYGSRDLDASLLMMMPVGFLPPTDPRLRGTVEAIERHLMTDGFVARYPSANGVDGLPAGEGAFLPCSFWLADNLALMGRHEEARAIFEKLLAVSNDVGLLAEEYDPIACRQLGNFPQAFSHVGLVNTARNLTYPASGPAEHLRKN
jgi:GH15 family glucan-1,4-alpha-glucosidase